MWEKSEVGIVQATLFCFPIFCLNFAKAVSTKTKFAF